ncbi:transposase [Nonomuraea sp. NPDC049625]|uniref:transposase n=1 Tax=Nonomuraea sp. NPDC049625 TaxID=3155775 RepID=UPI00341444F2
MANVGPVEVRVPRDVAGSFDPQQVCKRQRRLSGVDEMLRTATPGMRRGLQRVDDEFGAHVVGDRPAHQPT